MGLPVKKQKEQDFPNYGMKSHGQQLSEGYWRELFGEQDANLYYLINRYLTLKQWERNLVLSLRYDLGSTWRGESGNNLRRWHEEVSQAAGFILDKSLDRYGKD